MIRRFAIFGANGDLTSRYLIPAIARLVEAGHLPAGFEIVGLARQDWNTGTFRRHIAEQLEQHAAHVDRAAREAVISMLSYHRADATNPVDVARGLRPLDEPLVAYLALPPGIFPAAIESLASLGLPRGSRIVIEKPFGESLASAKALNRRLHRHMPEEAVFRVDHFLGKQKVQNILGLRFANRIFEPVWNAQHIQRVDIVWDEMSALEGRASYYDSAGALRDMIQNHLLQLLCLIAMEPLTSLDERELRDHKVDLLRAVRNFTPEEVVSNTIRGRYIEGNLDGQEIPAYVDEEGVDPERNTETFAQATVHIDNWRWSGVPFLLRSGKALSRDRREIAIHFRPVPHLAFGQSSEPQPNVFRISIDPDRISLSLNINSPGERFALSEIDLQTELAPPVLPDYGRLLLDVLTGDSVLSIRSDEAEESWRIVEPILNAWSNNLVTMREYPAGSEIEIGS